jgi:chromate reductase, NAD(P)H dehydrogenase (quinone)
MAEKEKILKLLGLAGSLREKSFNRWLLKNAQDMVPPGAEMEIFDLAGIPSYNQDLDGTPHPIVTSFKEKIQAADGLLICTPEYNYSIPGVLKNAIDAASRPSGSNSFNEKPAAIMGASTGLLGTARCQYHLRQVLVSLNVYMLNRPEVMVTQAVQKFDANGVLTDEMTRTKIKALLEAFVAWIAKVTPR